MWCDADKLSGSFDDTIFIPGCNAPVDAPEWNDKRGTTTTTTTTTTTPVAAPPSK